MSITTGYSNFLIGLEELKNFLEITANTKDIRFISLVASISRFIEQRTGRKFYPTTETRKFDYQFPSWMFFDEEDLLSISAIVDENGDGSIDTSIVLYYPPNEKPYTKIYLDPNEDYFMYDDFPEQAIRITGDWGYCDDTQDTGVTSPSLTAAAVTMQVSNGSKIDVGWTLLIDSERIFVEDLATVDSAVNINAAMEDYGDSSSVATPSSFYVGEVIRIDDEDMRVGRIDTSSLSVIRGYNGTTIASHSDASDVYVYRNFTIRRAQNGSTAAIHTVGSIIYRYVIPSEISFACGVLVARASKRSETGWSDMSTIGSEGVGITSFTKIMPVEVAAILNGYSKNVVGSV